MRIGLLITSIGNFGQKGFYNAQEVGLAKALDSLAEEVIVYKAVPNTETKTKTPIDGCTHSILYQVPVESNGINGKWNCDVMDSHLDTLIYFSDTQLALPSVYHWCCKHKIQLYPYIGVIESHSTNQLKKLIINTLFRRNIAVYKKSTCFVKNPAVLEKLKSLGVKKTILTPVGLDLSLLHTDYKKTSVKELKKKYGYQSDDKILLFIGRLIEEKQPVRMIDILSEIRKKDKSYRLLMVGTGPLKETVKNTIREYGLDTSVQMIDRIPNCEIWELYRSADAFVNLNQQEIFGMAILEAMYYGCKVVAWKAPGPSLIIENGKSGWLADCNDEVIEAIEYTKDISEQAHKRIIENFAWESSAKKMYQQAQKDMKK